MSEVAWIHLQVPAQPGKPGGIVSAGPRMDVAALPDVLQKDIARGGRWVFACDANLASGPQHVMTNLACHVTCAACRRTAAWKAAPDDGPFPKDPKAGFSRKFEAPVDPRAPTEAPANG